MRLLSKRPARDGTVTDDELDRCRAELALLEERASRAESALDGLPIGVVVLDQSARVESRNATATSMGGAAHGDVLLDAAIGDHGRRAVSGVESRETVELFGRPRRVIDVHARPTRGGAIVTLDDVSERARLDAVRTDFVANISHELKTPVGAIAVLDVTERTRPACEQRGSRLVTAAPEGGASIVADRRQIVCALSNLVDNALKYSDRGACVELEARACESSTEFVVRDHGIGIPSRDLERIFERFYRVDRARSRETGGTGLGLAIVRHVVTNHEGEINVQSIEGEGSTFTIRIPAR
jgi:two-component system, OmpR family, sensor histidine kinase SenX3